MKVFKFGSSLLLYIDFITLALFDGLLSVSIISPSVYFLLGPHIVSSCTLVSI